MMDFEEMDKRIARSIDAFFAVYDTSNEAARRAIIRMKLHMLYEIILSREAQPAATPKLFKGRVPLVGAESVPCENCGQPFGLHLSEGGLGGPCPVTVAASWSPAIG